MLKKQYSVLLGTKRLNNSIVLNAESRIGVSWFRSDCAKSLIKNKRWLRIFNLRHVQKPCNTVEDQVEIKKIVKVMCQCSYHTSNQNGEENLEDV